LIRFDAAAVAAAGRHLCSKKTDEEDEDEDKRESKLEVQFFSFTTFYYLVSYLLLYFSADKI